MDFVESIQYEPEFKELCDGLLRLEVGPLVQVYAGKGADQGVDADYIGSYDGVNGRWVFQYKFIHPATDPSQARARLKKIFVASAKGKVSEFAKPGLQGLCGYVLLTNAPATVALVQDLRTAFTAVHPEARFCVWDSASLNAMLHKHPHLARSRSQEMEELCLQEVIMPLWEWVGKAERIIHSWQEHEHVIWPLHFTTETRRVMKNSLSDPFEIYYEGALDEAILPDLQTNRAFPYAAEIAFPVALCGFEHLQRAFQELAAAHAEPIYALAEKLQAPHGLLGAFTHKERKRMALGLACVVIEMAWGYYSHRPGIVQREITVYDRYVYKGDQGHLAKEPLDALYLDLRERYQHGKKLPRRVVRAREQFAEALFSQADRLWYPATIHMDAPRDTADEEEPETA